MTRWAIPNFDDGDRNFENNSVFTRFDLLSEFDMVWKKSIGFRVSAAGWWDGGYDHLDGDSVATANNLVDGLPSLALDPHTKRYAKGPSGEFLDVFAFAKFDIGAAPVNLKLGQTTIYWGEGLLLGGAVHGISYSQNPIDVWKGLATPGAEAKELFRPRVGFNVQSQVIGHALDRGAVFLQLAGLRQPGVSLSGVGHLPEYRRPVVVGHRFVRRSAEPVCRPRARCTGLPARMAWQGPHFRTRTRVTMASPCAGARSG